MDAKRIPEVAAARREMAQGLRKMRRKNPKIARLVLKRMKAARDKMIKGFWSQ